MPVLPSIPRQPHKGRNKNLVFYDRKRALADLVIMQLLGWKDPVAVGVLMVQRHLQNEHYLSKISTTSLADALHVSRQAAWRARKKLVAMGFLSRVNKSTYRVWDAPNHIFKRVTKDIGLMHKISGRAVFWVNMLATREKEFADKRKEGGPPRGRRYD